MTIPSGVYGLEHDAIIELFSLDLAAVGSNEILHFCNYSQTNGTNVSFAGIDYAPIPIQCESFEFNGRQLPTPTLSVSNVLSILTPILLQYQDLIGAKLTRLRTFAKHLDGGIAADSNMLFEPDVYNIERKTTENKIQIVFELSSALDLGNLQLPNRLVLANLCQWRYRSPECGYTGGAIANALDQRVADLDRDVCGKRVRSCELRFGAFEPLPFGGFPGANNQRFG